MKKLIKTLCLVLCLITLFSFAACGGGGGGKSTKISIFKWDFASLNSARRQGTPIYNKLKEVNGGLDLEAVTCGYADWESTISNLYNTGNLPDVFVHYAVDRPTIFKKMIRDGAVLNWGDYVTEEKYPNIYQRLHEYDWLLERVDYLDNKYYFLPITIKQTHVMYVRADWIESLNAKLAEILVAEGIINAQSEMTQAIYDEYKFVLPETLTEFYRLAKAFTIYDPDNDNKNDTFGYTCSGNLMWYNNWIFQATGGTYWGLVDDGNDVNASWVTEENKKAVAFINKLYNEGIMDPDYAAMQDPTKISNFCSGSTGIMVDNVYYNTYLEQLRAAESMTMEEATKALAVIAPPKGETGTYGMRGNPGFWCGTAIKGNIKKDKITAILDMFEYMLSEEGTEMFTYGVEGAHYKVEGGQKVSLMGQDANGFNITAQRKDAAFDMHMFVDWSMSYNPGFSSNYDKVKGYMEMAEGYTYVDNVVYVQTPLTIDNWDNLGNQGYEEFVKRIGTNYGGYTKNKIGTVTWDSIYQIGSDFNGHWSTFTNNFLNKWGGKTMLDQLNKAVDDLGVLAK